MPAFEAAAALRKMLEDVKSVECVEEVKMTEIGLTLKVLNVPTRFHKRTANKVNVKTVLFVETEKDGRDDIVDLPPLYNKVQNLEIPEYLDNFAPRFESHPNNIVNQATDAFLPSFKSTHVPSFQWGNKDSE